MLGVKIDNGEGYLMSCDLYCSTEEKTTRKTSKLVHSMWVKNPFLKVPLKNGHIIFKEFAEMPTLTITGSTSTFALNLNIKIPLYVTKFSEPAQMDQATFFQRWRALNRPEQESQNVFTATKPIVKEQGSVLINDNLVLSIFSPEIFIYFL